MASKSLHPQHEDIHLPHEHIPFNLYFTLLTFRAAKNIATCVIQWQTRTFSLSAYIIILK